MIRKILFCIFISLAATAENDEDLKQRISEMEQVIKTLQTEMMEMKENSQVNYL